MTTLTTLSKMPAAELDHWLAEQFERKPTRHINTEATKYWHYDLPTHRWQPNDIISDPTMTLLLMEKLIAIGLRLHFSKKGSAHVLCVFTGEPWDKTAPMGVDFAANAVGRCVAEAYAYYYKI